MSKYIFLFDLDSTITNREILPLIADKVNKGGEMRHLTERTMQGEIPFKQSFLNRIELLKGIPIDEVQDLICNIELNNKIVHFIKENKERCFIVTGNLDIWIIKLIEKLGMEKQYYSSKAVVIDNRLDSVISVIDKKNVVDQFIQPLVAIGDGNNDADMIRKAEYGIGFGGVRNISPAVLECASHAFYDEEILYNFLSNLL